MPQPARERHELHRFNTRMTTAGKFWVGYVVGFILFVYALVDLVTRWFA